MRKTKVRFKMFCDYLNELQTIKGLSPLKNKQLKKMYKNYISETNTKWIDIFADELKKDIIGFLIIGYPPNCHPDADFYIEEAYVIPEFRRQKHMSLTVSRFIEANEGIYCLFILNNNIPARHFWPEVFAKHGYSQFELIDVGAGDEHCRQYGFKK